MDESTNIPSSSGQSNNNVVRFPKRNLRVVPPVEDEAVRETTRRAYVDEVSEAYANHIANKLAQQGFDIFDKQFDKHFGFAIEALRSTLLMTMGLHHPFQEIVEATVQTLAKNDNIDDDDYDPA
jgi:hypothetical protein